MINAIEEGRALNLDFSKLDSISGCVPVAVQDIDTLEVILLAYTNQEAMLQSF